MALDIALTHRTHYRYDRRVALGPQLVRLRPAPHSRTPILAYTLEIEPRPHVLNWQQDPFGNVVARIAFPERTDRLSVTVDLIADMSPVNPFDFVVDEAAVNWPFAYEAALAADLRPYLDPLPGLPCLDSYLGQTEVTGPTTVEHIIGLNCALAHDIAYRTRMEEGVQAPDETLRLRSGSCRDSGWLLVQLLRHCGLAARFVSGFLIQLAPDAYVAPGEEGAAERQDLADLHAWAEVYLPGAGWIGLDPTSGLLAGEGHIPLAATPAPASAAPISGTHGPAEVEFSVSLHVARMRATPRAARPYSEAHWQALLAAGDAVERRLAAGDVRLSMGGEPTFVAQGDGAAMEWTIAAMGPTKRQFADRLARRLAGRFAPGGLLHYGQGKWYPGEAQARWAFSIYWRSDGEPLWQSPGLIAEEGAAAPAPEQAERFAGALACTLGVPGDSAIAAWEDAAHFMLAEQKLPLGIAPDSGTLADPAERARLVRVLDRGLDKPAGWVLPLLMTRDADGGRRFITERWAFRRGHLFLVPGDSPIGLRLPLGGLPQIEYVDYPHVLPADPFADPATAPPPANGQQPCESRAAKPAVDQPGKPGQSGEPVRTALAVEVRDGHLCVFLPPLGDGKGYAALIGAIEATAASLQQPIRLEGYPPPWDPLLRSIKVTPDPGVIEVNVHPAASWEETVAITSGVHAEAHAVGLVAEKFTADGRHLGTGGGSHIVLGGMTPADSPFLRRPDLLASLIAYWQNHPSLSYLFAGKFVGPTSQAPRIDEARHEALYELEIALAQLPESGGAEVPPWLVDRLFRNLLVDATGNTHRAEICIDKLYAPEGPMGRLGLVELRAFEMPPHPRMGVAQQLLVRALVARFWERRWRQDLVRWGTTLHDRFMLPRFLWADLEDVIADLVAAGLPLEAHWFTPHLEFRFPVLGEIERAGVGLELRQALEPWLVLGEQSGPGGMSRMVDSSLDRVQVLVRSPAGDRHAAACNGYLLPLAPTGVAGERVAAVRFRAWRTAEGLHPTIPPHAPLTFDIVDTWSGRSIGGCRWHVSRPDGRNPEPLPVNAREAEARRRALFEPIGHSPAGASARTAGVHPDFPLTLDLRRAAQGRLHFARTRREP